MSFCKFSSERALDSFTLVDNSFITDHLPYATEDAIKVYILGLHFCATKQGTKEDFMRTLQISEDKLINAFLYWEEMGLLSIYMRNPLEICYFAGAKPDTSARKFKKEEFSDFNIQLESLFAGRIIEQNEYLKYYDFIKDTKIEKDAFLLIVGFCVKLKGSGVRSPYVLTVAKSWVEQGALSVGEVEEMLKQYEANSENMRQVYFALGKTSIPEFEDKKMLEKWMDDWGFDMDSIIYAAKSCKKKGGVQKLDSVLDDFYRHGIFSQSDMKQFTDHKQALAEVTKEISKTIGLYYGSIDYVIEIYTSPWFNKGFDSDALLQIAQYCMRRSIRSLEGMDVVVKKFYKAGLLTANAIKLHINALVQNDERIREIISASGSSRAVLDADRDYYKTWTRDWGISDQLIDYGATLARDRAHSFSYLNQIFASWKDKGIKTVEDAKKLPQQLVQPTKGFAAPLTGNERNYTKAELDALSWNLKDIDKLEI